MGSNPIRTTYLFNGPFAKWLRHLTIKNRPLNVAYLFSTCSSAGSPLCLNNLKLPLEYNRHWKFLSTWSWPQLAQACSSVRLDTHDLQHPLTWVHHSNNFTFRYTFLKLNRYAQLILIPQPIDHVVPPTRWVIPWSPIYNASSGPSLSPLIAGSSLREVRGHCAWLGPTMHQVFRLVISERDILDKITQSNHFNNLTNEKLHSRLFCF